MHVLLPLLLTVFTAAAAAAPLQLCYEDVPQPPWTVPGERGVNFALLARVQRSLGEQFRFRAKPWKRCLAEMKSGHVDGVLGVGWSQDRAAFAIYSTAAGTPDPSQAMYEESYDVYLRRGSAASWDGHVLTVPSRRVVAQAGYLVAEDLRKAGFQVEDSMKSSEDGLRLLADGVADAAVLWGQHTRQLAASDMRYANQVVHAPQPFQTMQFYLAISRKTFKREPARIEAIWRAIAEVRRDPAYRKEEAAARAAP